MTQSIESVSFPYSDGSSLTFLQVEGGCVLVRFAYGDGMYALCRLTPTERSRLRDFLSRTCG